MHMQTFYIIGIKYHHFLNTLLEIRIIINHLADQIGTRRFAHKKYNASTQNQ